MARLFEQTSQLLSDMAAAHSAALVAFSTGKDSLVVLDLACRAFKRVVPFLMYYAPDLQVIEERIAEAEQRWGVEVLQYPHPDMIEDVKRGVFGVVNEEFKALPKIGRKQIYDWVREDTGIDLVLTGEKKADFLTRRMKIRQQKDKNLKFPIAEWTNYEVLAYLQHRGIELPDTYADCSGLGLTTDSLLWLHDSHPESFDQLAGYFPFIGAVVKRREWYGVA